MTAKDLKNALLQEAVQGKLVPQIASEGNARDLLEEIRKARGESLPLATARKRSSATPSAGTPRNAPMEISDEEIPFDIPESWCWCRLGELVFNHGQKTPDQEFSYIDIGSIDNEHQKLNEKENIITPDKAPSRARKIVFEGDVIYSTVRPYLHNICIINKKFSKEPIASTGFAVMASTEVLFNKYLFYYLLSPVFDNYANDTDNAKGVAYPAINDDKLYKGVDPLPPLAEQKRIVDAIEKFMPLIEEYGKKETVLNQLNAQIGTLTKKAILQEAVQGKLVPQIPSEGNAKDLLDLLLHAKKDLVEQKLAYKKSETKPFYSEEDYPFDIPENWQWVQMSDISIIQEGAGIRKWQYREKGTQLLCVTNILNGKVDLEIKKLFIDTKEYLEKYKHLTVNKGDIVCSCSGGSWGKTAIYNLEDTIMMNTSTLRLRFYKDLADNQYLYYVVQSDFFKKQLLEQLSGMQPNFGYAHYSRICIPLPPLSEQKRIIAAIEQLLPLCEKLGR